MGAFADLPQETILHILKLAYDDEDEDRYQLLRRGLLQAARVHSALRRPAQELLTNQLVFDDRNKSAVAKFAEKGPTGWSARRVVFPSVTNGEMVAVLEKAKVGGVKGLEVDEFAKDLKLFAMPQLSKLETLDCSWDSFKQAQTWPTTLKHIKMTLFHAGTRPFNPNNVFARSAATLRSVRLFLDDDDQLEALATLAPQMTQLSNLSLQLPNLGQGAAIEANLPKLLSSLPRLHTLRLVFLPPSLLVTALDALQPAQLRSLSTHLVVPDSEYDPPPPHEADAFMADLRKCVESQAWAGGAEWEFSTWCNPEELCPLGESAWDETVGQIGKKAEWEEVRKVLVDKGVEYRFQEVETGPDEMVW